MFAKPAEETIGDAVARLEEIGATGQLTSPAENFPPIVEQRIRVLAA